MIRLLTKLFVKNSDDINNSVVRSAYGKLLGMIGIVCNVVLFIIKFLAGTIFNSVAMIADAVNNLSDASSSVISLIGFKLADKKADAEHPYGHARYEYLSGLIVAFMILMIGIEILKTGFDKIINPANTEFSLVAIVVLIISIALKLWLAYFNNIIGKKINSKTLIATAQDSRNDVISTSAVLAGIIISHFLNINLDGWIGIAVAVFILYSGIVLIKETIDPLLGKSPDPELVKYICDKIMTYPQVIGIHDLIIHDYGPCRQFASVHVEMPAESDPLESHDIIDNIERDFIDKDNIFMVAHYDPIVTNDERVTKMNDKVKMVLKDIDERLHFHDLRIVPGITHSNVIFDCVRPHEFSMSDEELKAEIIHKINEEYPDYYCVITVETSFSDDKRK